MSTVIIDNLIYSLSGTTASVTEYNGTPPSNWNLVIPSTITDSGTTYTVTSIGQIAFKDKQTLVSVIIPTSVTSIGESSFHVCTSLTSINIPSSVTTIGNYAFSGCTSLTNITINSFISNLGFGFFGLNNPNSSWSFNYRDAIPNGICNGRSGVTSVTIGNGITSIGNNAFSSCSSLTSINIPSSVTSIGYAAFDNCTNLTSVTFLGLIPTVGAFNFRNASDTIIYDPALNAGNPNLAAMLALFTTNPSIVPICFPAGTPVVTDQGTTAIEKINPSKNTIRGKKIVAITKTTTLEDKIVCIEKDALAPSVPSQKTFISRQHKLFYNKQMIKAKNLIGQVDGVYNKKYNGEVLYNVLLETHEKMLVNNLIVETLDPKNVVAQLYNGSLSVEERNNAIININQCANEYKKQYGKLK